MTTNELFDIDAANPDTVAMYVPSNAEYKDEVYGVVFKQADGWYYCMIHTSYKFMNKTGLFPVQKHYKRFGATVNKFMAKYGLVAA